MVVLAGAVSMVLAAWMLFFQPLAGRRRYRQLLERLPHDPGARLHHYRRGITFEWAGTALVGLLALAVSSRLRSLWPDGDTSGIMAQIPFLAVALVGVTFLYRAGGEGMRQALEIQLRPVAALLPRTATERRWFALLAVTAGICEEVLYRGFGLAALRWAAPDLSKTALIVITGAAFGLAHLYQGRRGVVLTGLLGAYLAWLTISTGTLIPAIVIHALMDLRILALPLDAVPPWPGAPAPEPAPEPES